MNRVKTVALLATLTALLMWAGQALGGAAGLWVSLGLASVMNIGAYWFSDRIVLRMNHAREMEPAEYPELHTIVRTLAWRAGLPMPRVYLIPEMTPNAFATGRSPNHGVVALTEGLLQMLDRREVAAVIAHELGHIKHRDTLLMAVTATVAGALSMLAETALWGSLFGGGSQDDEEESGGGHAWGGLMGVFVAPIIATMLQMSISRAREFMADAAAAQYTGDPLSLASALRKIEAYSQQLPMQVGSPAIAHLYIQNPFSAEGLAGLFRTHPPTEQRVERLIAMADGRLPMAA